ALQPVSSAPGVGLLRADASPPPAATTLQRGDFRRVIGRRSSRPPGSLRAGQSREFPPPSRDNFYSGLDKIPSTKSRAICGLFRTSGGRRGSKGAALAPSASEPLMYVATCGLSS